MTRKRRAVLIVCLVLLLVAVDQFTKLIAIHYLRGSGSIHVFFGDLFRLQYAENTGAFLSLGAGLPDGIRKVVMIGFNSLILAGVLVYLFLAKRIAWAPLVALVCIAGGGIGNLIDRLFRDGRVVDFMNMGLNLGNISLRTGIFNVADIAIMAGLFLIIFHELVNVRRDGHSHSEPRAKKKR